MELRLGFLASGRGSNVEAILDSIACGDLEASPKVLISSKTDAPVLEIANKYGVPCYCIEEKSLERADEFIVSTLRGYDVNLVVLAGYMRKLGKIVIDTYPNRILNIHPSLLPKYGGKDMYGMKPHKAVIASEDTESGATIHLVTYDYDAGRILAQYKVLRYDRDTAESLADRVLRIEHALYPQTLIDIQKGIILLD